MLYVSPGQVTRRAGLHARGRRSPNRKDDIEPITGGSTKSTTFGLAERKHSATRREGISLNRIYEEASVDHCLAITVRCIAIAD